MRSPKAFGQRIRAAIRLRVWKLVQRCPNARPWYCVARRVSVRARAAGPSFSAGGRFLIGTIGTAPRSVLASWQRRVSQATSAVPVPIGASAGIWPSRSEAPGCRRRGRGEVHGAEVGRRRVHGQMHLAPLATALRPVLARLPFAIARELAPGAVDQPVQGPVSSATRALNGQGSMALRGPAEATVPSYPASGTAWRSPARASPVPPAGAGSRPSRRSGEAAA